MFSSQKCLAKGTCISRTIFIHHRKQAKYHHKLGHMCMALQVSLSSIILKLVCIKPSPLTQAHSNYFALYVDEPVTTSQEYGSTGGKTA